MSPGGEGEENEASLSLPCGRQKKNEEHPIIKYVQNYTIQTMHAWVPWFNLNSTMITLSEGYKDMISLSRDVISNWKK